MGTGITVSTVSMTYHDQGRTQNSGLPPPPPPSQHQAEGSSLEDQVCHFSLQSLTSGNRGSGTQLLQVIIIMPKAMMKLVGLGPCKSFQGFEPSFKTDVIRTNALQLMHQKVHIGVILLSH